MLHRTWTQQRTACRSAASVPQPPCWLLLLPWLVTKTQQAGTSVEGSVWHGHLGRAGASHILAAAAGKSVCCDSSRMGDTGGCGERLAPGRLGSTERCPLQLPGARKQPCLRKPGQQSRPQHPEPCAGAVAFDQAAVGRHGAGYAWPQLAAGPHTSLVFEPPSVAEEDGGYSSTDDSAASTAETVDIVAADPEARACLGHIACRGACGLVWVGRGQAVSRQELWGPL